ncbi:peptidoglycan-binding domain-containing protein [Paracoccus fistulariae]|uniref:Peptidoglycan binding-like domain-containing protein n=1 Tax=Paracoccus fistulariae TaxID=658446 RepID=A0ABY7SLC5_9RHOB|nr:peptidoglycan-binding domain-containing protein [Paracoccus fistulariae]MDB6181977.1 peptidoglycan-binding domain-containing protein [Paracoccus fistulariae]WCR06786.1 hypothetical protein JHX87_15105 [Paracoccus fistulariae]
MSKIELKELTFLAFALPALIAATEASSQVDHGTIAGHFVAQQKLEFMGYDVGKADAIIGPKTLEAIRKDAELKGYEASMEKFQEFYIGEVIRGSKPYDNEEVKKRITEAVGEKLLDPYSAVYDNWRILPSGAICVDVNAKNTYGAFTGSTPYYATVIFNTVMIPFHDENLNFWSCYLDPRGP